MGIKKLPTRLRINSYFRMILLGKIILHYKLNYLARFIVKHINVSFTNLLIKNTKLF